MLTQVVTSFGDFWFSCNIFKDNCELPDVTEQIQLPAAGRKVFAARGALSIFTMGTEVSQLSGEETSALFSTFFSGGPFDKPFFETLLLEEGQRQVS